MGASFVDRTFSGKLTTAQVKQTFTDWQDEDRHENGHSYSGGIGMASGLKFVNRPPFASVSEAVDWLDENCQKWDAALCVRAKKDNPPPDDLDGGELWVIGAICAS